MAVDQFKRDDPTQAQVKAYDLNAVVSLELIREHTKTDDVPSVTDAQLALYRKAALEAAQNYTGLLLTGRKWVVEQIDLPALFGARKHRFERGAGPHYHRHTVKHGFGDAVAYWQPLTGHGATQIAVDVNATTVRLPLRHTDFSMGCCDPCGGSGAATGTLQYVAGYGCEDDVPAAIVLGVLKYIAHVIENAGDNVVAMSVDARSDTGASTEAGNNPALASGAIDIWRSVIPDMF